MGGCELPNTSARSRTLVFCQSSKYVLFNTEPALQLTPHRCLLYCLPLTFRGCLLCSLLWQYIMDHIAEDAFSPPVRTISRTEVRSSIILHTLNASALSGLSKSQDKEIGWTLSNLYFTQLVLPQTSKVEPQANYHAALQPKSRLNSYPTSSLDTLCIFFSFPRWVNRPFKTKTTEIIPTSTMISQNFMLTNTYDRN